MEQQKFGRVKAFLDDLEKVELVENEEALMLLGTAGEYYGTGNNCMCNGNNCSCNTVLGCGSGGSGGSGA